MFSPPLAREGGTPAIIPGKETRVLACRGGDADSQKQGIFPARMILPSGDLDWDTPSSIRSVAVNYFAISVATTFGFFFFLSFFLVILEAFIWIFPCSGFLYVSIIFRLLGGLVSNRQQCQLVLTEPMCSWRKCGLS